MTKLIFLLLFSCTGFVYGQRMDTVLNLPDHYKERVEKFKNEPVAAGGILFLGDSITEGANWKTLAKDSTVVNRGIGGDDTFGVLRRLGNITLRQPAKVFLLIGVNDLSKNIPDETIMENILSIVGRIHSGSPKTTVYVQSILPLNAAHEKFPQQFLNKEAHVVTINGQLSRYAAKMNYIYVNLYGEFTDGQGRMDEKFTTDGLHLSKAGYTHWVNILIQEKFL